MYRCIEPWIYIIIRERPTSDALEKGTVTDFEIRKKCFEMTN